MRLPRGATARVRPYLLRRYHEVLLFFMVFMPFMVEHFLVQKSRIKL